MAGTAVAKRERTPVGRPLKILIPLIQADLERGDQAGMEYYADAGDKLIEAKESGQVAYGYWSAWLSKNFHRSDRQAQTYMRVARLRAENEKRAGSAVLPRSLNEVEGQTKRARKRRKGEREFKAVLRDVEPDVYAQEQQTRDDEIRLHREMAIELVDVGFKALATRLHPDRGGSEEAMRRLNRVRKELHGIASTRRFV